MIRVLEDMPAGTLGVEAVGTVTEQDYRDVLVPLVSPALDRQDVRLMFLLGDDFESYSAGAMWADVKLWAGHLKGWRKVAVVSDADWLEDSIEALGWMMPGRVKVFETDDVDDAKGWLAGIHDDDD